MNICKLEGGALCYNPAEKYHLTLSAIELGFFLPILAPVFFFAHKFRAEPCF